MFDNIGGKIKGLTWIIAVVGMALSGLMGIILMFTANFLSGLLLAVVGGVACNVGSFFAYGFGQLIENTDILVAEMKKDRKNSVPDGNTPGIKKFVTEAPAAAAPKPTAPAPVERIKVENPDVPVKVIRNGSGYLLCPACEAQQRDDRYRCFSCGVKFINGQPGIPFWCGSCGQEGPYDGACPKCGSTVKLFQ